MGTGELGWLTPCTPPRGWGWHPLPPPWRVRKLYSSSGGRKHCNRKKPRYRQNSANLHYLCWTGHPRWRPRSHPLGVRACPCMTWVYQMEVNITKNENGAYWNNPHMGDFHTGHWARVFWNLNSMLNWSNSYSDACWKTKVFVMVVCGKFSSISDRKSHIRRVIT